MSYSLTWNLENIYAGGADSTELQEELQQVEQDLKTLQALLQTEKVLSLEEVKQAVQLTSALTSSLREASAFSSCLLAQNMADKKAAVVYGKIQSLSASFDSVMSLLDAKFSAIDDASWATYLQEASLSAISFNLNEKRDEAKRKMDPQLEALVSELAVDGYHGWGDFYNTIVLHTQFEWVNDKGETELLSAGQMFNKLSEPNRDIRAKAFEIWEQTWQKQADYAADVMNRITGFRQKLYEKRNWQSVLEEPLNMNRMKAETLDAMWRAVDSAKVVLKPYFERKAELLNVEKLDWHDIDAPLATASKKVSYDEAAAYIVEQFNKFSPKLAQFAERAFNESWIEAEDRSGKRPGGFCTSFPKSKETRIFMTFSGTQNNVSTLAHELGHAYHQDVMDELPILSQNYAMNVAETASTFAELIVMDNALQEATDREEKLALVEEKIQNGIAFMMNIHARFIYETAVYEKRKNGPLTSEQYTELMLEAQEKSYLGLIETKHPNFWVAKLHFYLTDVPFYNYPYTFGYLFSAGIYQLAKQEGPTFAAKYDALLQDTGRLTVEELAQKHLGVDLTKVDFWEKAARSVEADVELFMQLTDKK